MAKCKVIEVSFNASTNKTTEKPVQSFPTESKAIAFVRKMSSKLPLNDEVFKAYKVVASHRLVLHFLSMK